MTLYMVFILAKKTIAGRRGRGLWYKKVRDARRKILIIKPLKETNVGWFEHYLTPKRYHLLQKKNSI